MESLSNLLQQIFAPERFTPALKILNQLVIPKLDNEIILLLRNVVRINNKATHQFDGLALAVKVIQQSLNLEYNSIEWSCIGENFSGLIIAIFDSFLIYRNTPIIEDANFNSLIIEAGKCLLPVVDKIDCLRVSVNNNGYSSILQIICLDELDFLVRKEIFLLFKPIIVKSDTRQRKNIMNSNEFFMSKMAAMVLNCGDFETQEAIVEVLMRFSYTSKQKLNKILCWFREYPAVLTATKLLDYKSFDISCRKFLNSVNRSISSNVVTLSCFEAYANEIKLQKPRSDGYEELWVDFSLKTGIIHIVCDSGANAWLRLFIDSKNVRNSFFSSRLLKKNEIEIKGKQILLELTSPLEIEHHLKEALIVTVTLIFVESSDLDNLQINFFNRWYHHLTKKERNNQFIAVKKAFQENTHHHCKQKDKFFKGTSLSSLSSIHSCSTCTVRHCCHNKGKLRSPSFLKSSRQDFSTSTPKDINKFQKEHFPNNNLVTTCGIQNICPSSSKHVNLNSTPTISGGIFNHATLRNFQEVGAKSSVVKGIFLGDDKKEDGLFKKMMEKCLKKEINKEIDNKSKKNLGKASNDDKSVLFTKPETPTKVVARLNFDIKKLPESSQKPLKLGIPKKASAENIVTNPDQINIDDHSEDSDFIMASHGIKHKILNENHETNGISDSSSSQICTSDETPNKSSHKQLNLLEAEEKKLKSQQSFEKIVNPDNSLRNESQGNIWNDNSSFTKKLVPHSPYLKLFNSRNSSISNQSQQGDLNVSNGKNTESSNSAFKLKPPTLKVGNLIQTEPVSQNSFSFSSTEKLKKTKRDLTSALKSISDKGNSDLVDFKNKTLNVSNISQISLKESNVNKIDTSSSNTLTEIKTKARCKMNAMGKDKDNIPNGKDIVETNFNTSGSLTKFDYINHLNITGEKNDNNEYLITNKAGNVNKQIELTSPTEDNKTKAVNENDSNQQCLTQTSNFCHSQKASILPNVPNDNDDERRNGTRKKKKSLPNKRNSRVSTGTLDAVSSGPNTTISSQRSLHCIAIPKRTYSTKPTIARNPPSPEQTFDHLIKQRGRNNLENEIPQKKTRSGRKRKLFTPNSSLEDMSPFKPGEDSVRPAEILFQDNPTTQTSKRKPKQNLNAATESKRKKKTSQCPESLTNVYNFRESSPSSVVKEENQNIIQRRKSLRMRVKKRYKEISSEESDIFQNEITAPKKKSSLKPKKSSAPATTITLPEERFSISEKVSRFVWSMNENREHSDPLRQEELESEMRLSEAPVEENKSDLSQLESVEPPIWLSSSEAGIPSLQGSPDSFNAPTELIIKDDSTRRNVEEIEFLQSVIKNIECLSLSVRRKNPKINSQDKIVKTIESFTSSGIDEINKLWEEARQSLQLMISNLDNMSESYKTFMISIETRMKDMIESSVSDFNMDRSSSNSRSENLCKELKKMCHERHKLLKKQ